MVARLCVTTTNCVLSASVPMISANLREFTSSSAASLRRAHKGRRVGRHDRAMSAMTSALPPPDKSAIAFARFPGGVAMMSIPATSPLLGARSTLPFIHFRFRLYFDKRCVASAEQFLKYTPTCRACETRLRFGRESCRPARPRSKAENSLSQVLDLFERNSNRSGLRMLFTVSESIRRSTQAASAVSATAPASPAPSEF